MGARALTIVLAVAVRSELSYPAHKVGRPTVLAVAATDEPVPSQEPETLPTRADSAKIDDDPPVGAPAAHLERTADAGAVLAVAAERMAGGEPPVESMVARRKLSHIPANVDGFAYINTGYNVGDQIVSQPAEPASNTGQVWGKAGGTALRRLVILGQHCPPRRPPCNLAAQPAMPPSLQARRWALCRPKHRGAQVAPGIFGLRHTGLQRPGHAYRHWPEPRALTRERPWLQ